MTDTTSKTDVAGARPPSDALSDGVPGPFTSSQKDSLRAAARLIGESLIYNVLCKIDSERNLPGTPASDGEDSDAVQSTETSPGEQGSIDLLARERAGAGGCVRQGDGPTDAGAGPEPAGVRSDRRSDETPGPEDRLSFREKAEQLGTTRINAIVRAYDDLVTLHEIDADAIPISNATHLLRVAIRHACDDLPTLKGVTR